MPDLIGLDTEAARRILHTAGLRSGMVRFEWSREFETGVVIGQDPVAGRWVPEGTRVDVTVSSGIVREDAARGR
jgi:beta-lactam-binding protein with PASTA domain